MMFLLRSKLVLLSIAFLMLGWWIALGYLPVMANGSQPSLGLRAFMTAIAVAGTFVLTVLPGFLLYRAIFTAPPTLALEPAEAVFATATANHFLSGEGRSGKLVLTESRIGFVPSRFNVQLDTVSVPWDKVECVRTADSMLATTVAALGGIDEKTMQHGFLVELNDGRRERFIAFKRVELARSLERLRSVPAGQRAEALARARDAGELTGLQAFRGA